MKPLKIGSIVRPKRKAEKSPKIDKVYLPIGAKLPGGYEPVVIVRLGKNANKGRATNANEAGGNAV